MTNHLPFTLMIRSLVIAAVLTTILGCSPKTKPGALSPSQSHEKLAQILKEENNLDVTMNEFEHTFWIYLPLEENFLQMKAKPQGSINSDQSSVKPGIKFLEGTYHNRNFNLKYDIAPLKSYAKDYGYTSQMSDGYITKQRNILTAIYRAFSDADNPPLFFIIVIADIVNGLETRITIHYHDLIRANMDQTFLVEYSRRAISEQPTGNKAIIGDRTGEYIDYKDITWPEFLAKQMVFRINYKYQQSAFPPSEDTRSELVTIAAQTVGAYDFTDFDALRLHDLSDDSTYTVTGEELSAYASESSQGRLIHIRFQ